MHPLLNIAVKAARKAGQTIMRGYERVDTLKLTQKSRHDFATEIDFAAEQDIVHIIRKAYPNHSILAEESGLNEGTSGRGGDDDDVQWIVDPLDGTANFMRGLPQFAVSIAIQVKGVVEHGLVYDPFKQELFVATKGSGAMLDDRRLRINNKKQLDGAMVSMVLPFKTPKQQPKAFKLYSELAQVAGHHRRMGAAALDLAYVAAGRLDGYCETRLQPWDLAAGALIVSEASGIVSDLKGGKDFLNRGEILAGGSRIYSELMQLLERHYLS